MSQAKRDENRVTTLIGVDHIGFSTPTNAAVKSTTHELLVSATADSLPLPTGASTSANQVTANTLLGGIAGLTPSSYDYISQSQNSTQDIWIFKTGGSGGTTIATITITYTGTDKTVILTVAKT